MFYRTNLNIISVYFNKQIITLISYVQKLALSHENTIDLASWQVEFYSNTIHNIIEHNGNKHFILKQLKLIFDWNKAITTKQILKNVLN